MNSFSRSLLFGLCLVSATSAHAQRADHDSGPASTAMRTAPTAPPTFTVHASGSSKAILVPFGPFITQTGVGAGGANVSELYTTFTLGSVGYNIFGYGMQASVNIRVADDFNVPSAQTWSVSKIKWLCYQTGGSTAGTITSLNLNLWNTNPNGQLPGGQFATGGDMWESESWTGVWRVLDSGLTANNRALIEVSCCGRFIPVLSTGNYWLEAFAGGALTSGPWSPPKVKAGQVPPTGDPWNGLQSVSGGAFAQVYDTGNPLGSINEPSDFLFQVEGTGGSGVTTFCTSKTSSLGCTPSLTASSSSVSKSGAPACTLTATPVPGGAGLPGLLIYSKLAPATPISTSFGFLCLSSFARAGAFPASPGGSFGTCTGAYNWNLAAIAAGTGSINVGDMLRIQGWYRDPGFPPPGNANFTHGIDAAVVVPDVGDSSCTAPPTPTGNNVNLSGGEGSSFTSIGGNNFGLDPNDLKLLLANGIGFGDVTSTTGTTLDFTVFKVGLTGSGPMTVIRGHGFPLPDQSSVVGSITGNATLIRVIVNGQGTNFGNFNLAPSSSNTVSASVNTPMPGGIVLDMNPITGTGLVYRLALKSLSGEFNVYQGRIDFVGAPIFVQDRVQLLVNHLNASFGSLGVLSGPTSGGTSVRVSMAGAAYGGIVVAGI
jgi:hypothetical protein